MSKSILEVLKEAAPDLYKVLTNNSAFKTLSANDQVIAIKKAFGDNLNEILEKARLVVPKTGFVEGCKHIFYNFLAMDESWTLKRNILGALMVDLPEWPAYFIPSFTQAKTTGDAKDLKKGEGIRGLLTGGLEGLAVGALISGKDLKRKELIPCIAFGAGLQFISSKVFPFIGEKMGSFIYRKNLAKNGGIAKPVVSTVKNLPTTATIKQPLNNEQKLIQSPYSQKSPGLKV